MKNEPFHRSLLNSISTILYSLMILYSCKRIYLDMSKFIEVRTTTDIYRKIKIALKFKILYEFL